MFHFDRSKIVKKRLPKAIMFQIIRDMPGEQNVSGITAIHYPLGKVNTRASDVGLLVQISDFIHRTAVNSHSHLKFGMAFEFLANLKRAENRRFRTGAENKRATVASR